MALLTTNWQPMDPAGALAAYTSGVKLGQADNAAAMEAQQQAQAMIAKAQQQKELEARTQANYALKLLQEQRIQHAADLQADFNSRRLTATEAAAKARQEQLAADNAPYVDRYQGGAVAPKPAGASNGVDLWNAGATGSDLILGKITDYGQPNDPDSDSLTAGGKSAIGNLTPNSMAVSRDVEAQMKAAGIKIGQPVTLKLDDGSSVTRVWDDRTADVYKGRPIRGRFDLYSPGGESPLRDKHVVGFSPGGVSIENTGPLPSTKPIVPDAAASILPPMDSTPAGQTIMRPTMSDQEGQDMAMQLLSQRLAQAGVPVKEAKKQLAQAAERMATAKASISKGQPVHFPDGSLRERNPDGSWTMLGEKPVKDTSGEDARKREDQIMQRINTERGKANDLDKQLTRLSKQGKEPSWPWEDNGKFYKMEDGTAVAIDKAEHDTLFERAKKTEWAALNDQRAKQAQKVADLSAQLDSVRAPAPAAPKDSQPKELTPEIAAQIFAEAGKDPAKARALAKQRGFAL